MIYMDNFISDIFFSILFGLLVGYILSKYLYNQPEIYHGPKADEIKKIVFQDPGTKICYRFTPVIHICPPSMAKKHH